MTFINRKLGCAAAALLLLTGGPLQAAPKKSQGRFSPLAYSMRQVRKSPPSSARKAFARFSSRHGKDWKIRYSPRTALPEAITDGRTRRYSGAPEQVVAAFFSENSELLKIDPAQLQLALKRENLGLTHLQYQQTYQGLPVEFAYVRAHVTASGEVAGYQAKFEPGINLSIVPGIPAEQAELAVVADLGAQLKISRRELVIFPDEETGTLKLAWKIRGRTGGIWVYYIDAQTGSVLLKYDDMRRWCGTSYLTVGSSSGTVYEISPIPAGSGTDWAAPVIKPLSDQYFWIGGTSVYETTNLAGDYCSDSEGKVFSTFKGPYFAVTNYRGFSAHYDNGGGEWRSYTHPSWTTTPNPYDNSSTYPYTLTLSPAVDTGSEVLAKMVPRFAAFGAGALNEDGGIDDGDGVSIKSAGLTGNNTVARYIGTRGAFYGPSVESNSYTLTLQTDESGTGEGFSIHESSYMVLTNAPGTASNGTAAAPLGSVLWSTDTVNSANFYLDTSLGHASGLDEVNVFYHLNKARRYFQDYNKNPFVGGTPAIIDLDKRVPVMVHASGRPDDYPGIDDYAMRNAFFDLENENLFFGDGLKIGGIFRSFALDGTVVRHEYAHLAVHRIYPIINFGEFGAISEALSDYFSLASFWSEGHTSLDTLGNFLGSGRPLSGPDKQMPGDWQGEIYNDSLILSQALYSLRDGGSRSLGTVGGASVFAGRPRADFLVWAALFYLPDSFANFHQAMIDACKHLRDEVALAGGCTDDHLLRINNAFAAHGIPGTAGDAYETGSNSALCVNNNGPECATDLDFLSTISATVLPAGDIDYYSIPVPAGNFRATLTLPRAAQDYKAYALFLFDENRNYLTEAVPVLNEWGGVCPIADCRARDATVTLDFLSTTASNRYYLMVAGGPTYDYSNSAVTSTSPYTLTLSYPVNGSARVFLGNDSTPDNDKIAFTAYYNSFPMLASPSSQTVTGAEQVFEYAQLRDHNNVKLEDTRTNLAGSFLRLENPSLPFELGEDAAGKYFSGRVLVQPGFAARYPGAGTVSLEIFGRNHMGHVVSLGISNRINLTADKAAVVSYNNKLGAPGAKTIVKYELQSAGNLSLKLYTQTGALVKTLYDGPASGKGTVDWDGTNSSGGKAASGIYFLRAIGPGINKTDKIAIIR